MSDGLIAIVGASCRFPGAPGLDAFWQLLISGTDAITEIDPQRWATRYFFHPKRSERGKSYTWSAGVLDGIDLFEPAFFGISPREAVQMDPQQRLLLELVWHAVEDAGIPSRRLAGSETGVYIGASSTDYTDSRFGDPAGADTYFMTGGVLSILSNRISYIFDLHGPSLTVDTACSSSLVALHQACQALRAGHIERAIVGGVNLLLSPYPFIGFSQASMLSQRGRCFAFDERADGYARAEGGGIVILKPLAQALADGDLIRAVIHATGINSDGRTIGLSLPSQAAQSNLLRSVYADAGISPDEIAFFEMHGTGTPAGDPIEAAAVGTILGQARTAPLPIGSVKTNVGHLEPASGMAGLLKSVLALEHGVVPPTLNCERPNPNIAFDELNLRLIRSPEAIARKGARYAGVNSFGFGGTNGHVVLGPSPRLTGAAPTGEIGLPPLAISARSEVALRAVVQNWRETLARTSPARAPALFRAAARSRDHHQHRLVLLGDDLPETGALLDGFLDDEVHPGIIAGTAVREGRVAFAFSGNGAQWPGMGQRAFRANAAFRDAIIEADTLLELPLGWSVAEAIESGVAPEPLMRADVAQPLLFAIQFATVRVLRQLGATPSGYVGHSVGEIAAAWAAGALSLADAVRVVVARSRNQERTRGTGRMAALGLGATDAETLIAEIGCPIEIGAINSRQSVTVSGSGEAIEKLATEARRRGIVCRKLDLDFAFHSVFMEPIRDTLLADLAGLKSQAPGAGMASTVTGNLVEAGQLDASYWWRNIRKPVRFTEALTTLIADGYRILVEIGPHPVLQSYLHDSLRAAQTDGRVLSTLNRKQPDGDPFASVAAQCHVAGGDFTSAKWFEGAIDPRGLPLYQWQRERCWVPVTVEDAELIKPQFDHPLLGFRQHSAVPCWVSHLDQNILPWIADHAVEGVPVFPAAGVVEMALAAAQCRRPDAALLEIADLELRRPLPFDEGRGRELRSTMSSAEGDWELSSRTRLSDEPLTVHAVGRIVTTGDIQTTMHAEPILSPARIVDSVTLYALAARVGLDYGTQFRTVSRILVYGTDAAVVELDATAIDEPLEPYLIHPALLDGALQGLLALLAERESTLQAGISFLPWRFGRVRVAAALGRVPKRAQIRLTRIGSRSASADIVLCDERGAVIAELSECWFRRVALARRSSIDDRALRVELVPAPLVEPNRPAVFERIGEILARLATAVEVDLEQGAEQALLLEALVAAVALRSILPANEPGADGPGVVDAEGSFTIDDLIESGRIAPAAGPLFGYLLHLLERFGAASSDGREWRLAADHELPDIAEVWRLLLAEVPSLVGELALVPVVSEDLPRLFVDGIGAGRVGAAPMIENLLQSSAASAAGIDVVSRTLGEIASEWPAGRKLRVLELGADAGTTRRFLNGLAAHGVAFSYVATNPEPEQAGRLEFVADEFVEATARCWSPIDTDDPADGRFDVVLSVNASAWLQFDEAALLRLRELLAPGGLLLAVEPEPNPLWNVVFGRNPDWWQGAGEDGSPLRSAESWCRELELVGFEAPGTAPVSAGPWPNIAVWGGAPAVVPPVVASVARLGTIHLVGVDTAATRDLADALAATGQVADVVDADAFLRASDFPEVESGNANAFVVFVVDASGPMEKAGSADAGAQAVGLLAKLAPKMAERRSPFAVVTTGAQNSAIGAAVYGFGRVLLNEMPHLSLRLIDLPAGSGFSTRARLLASELASESEETEIIWTADGRHVPRLRRGLPPRWATAEDAVTLGAERPGGLDSLGWHLSKPRPPGPGEVEIDVRAAGLNFRDMMWAMGLLPEEALIDGFAGATFGLECSGVVRKVGAGVDGLAVGDRVAGFAPAALSSRVTTAAHAVMPVSAETSFAEAATIPVAFVTAIYALGTLGRLAEGEHVLVHAAAGGVGLAAIQYAKYRGAVVIATAGSPVKRSFLRLAGADHVLDSRDLGFADAVRSLTGGTGVDVVLNSLSGEAMEQSLAVLKPFGRFLELGKRDYYLNSRIHLRPFRQNISYFGIDVDQLPIQRPELARSLLAEVSAALAEGAIRPLAHRQFAFAEIDDAFRLMQASGHIGKLVLAPSDNAGVRLHGLPEFAAHVDGTYLVTGGLSGFGFEAALWLVQRGARSIALVGRRGIQTPGAVERVNELRNAGAEVSVHAVDVANRNALSAVLGRIRAEQPPLRGIIHAASAIGDALVGEIDPATILPILQPKLGGALALDELTRKDPIDLFLLFSSATTLLGAPGQGVYVAANAALEGLARNRHAAGRPALAIAWGPIEDAGYLAERPDARDALARRLGAKPMPAVQALSCLSAVIASGLPVVAIAETSWHEARRFLPILATPFFADARGDAEAAPGDNSLIERLASLSGDEALALLKTVVAEEAAGILRLPAGSFDPLRPLSEVGMDSLMAVELRLALETRLRIDLPLVSLAEGTSVTSIAGRLAGAVSGRQQKSELIGLVERYEAADDGRVAAAVNEAEDVFDPDDIKPEAAE